MLIGKYFDCRRESLLTDVINNPVYSEKIDSDFRIIGGDVTPPMIQVVDECIDFSKAVVNDLKLYKLEKYKTQEYLDLLFRAFPIKGDMTLEGWKNDRRFFIRHLQNKGLTEEQILRWVNSLPVCCAAVLENLLFKSLSIDKTFVYAYNHLCVLRNGREFTNYQVTVIDEVELFNLVLKEGENKALEPAKAFSLKYDYRKYKKIFAERLYCLLAEGPVQFIHEETVFEDFEAVLFTPDCYKEVKRIIWKCNTQDVYLLVKKLTEYINGINFDNFGRLCISKTGKYLKNLKASRTDTPRHRAEIEFVFRELELILKN